MGGDGRGRREGGREDEIADANAGRLGTRDTNQIDNKLIIERVTAAEIMPLTASLLILAATEDLKLLSQCLKKERKKRIRTRRENKDTCTHTDTEGKPREARVRNIF